MYSKTSRLAPSRVGYVRRLIRSRFNNWKKPSAAAVSWQLPRRLGVRISMDGKGRFLDNIFIERLWRTLKYECVYLHAWETGSETKAGIRKWMTFYNRRRPHSALGGKPPALVYWQTNDINQPDQQVQRVA